MVIASVTFTLQDAEYIARAVWPPASGAIPPGLSGSGAGRFPREAETSMTEKNMTPTPEVSAVRPTWATMYPDPELRFQRALEALKASTGYREDSYWLGSFVAVMEQSHAEVIAALRAAAGEAHP
jgi:hypothetical protein